MQQTVRPKAHNTVNESEQLTINKTFHILIEAIHTINTVAQLVIHFRWNKR